MKTENQLNDYFYHNCLASLAMRISSRVMSVFNIPNKESDIGLWAFFKNSSSCSLVMPIFLLPFLGTAADCSLVVVTPYVLPQVKIEP